MKRKILEEEAVRWVAMGLIDESQREQIVSLYPQERFRNPLITLFAILGSLLLGLGIILIFATNWQHIPRVAKLVIAFIPLVAAMGIFGFTLTKKRDSTAFREGAAMGLCLAVFATIALVGQIFHLPSDLDTFIRLCMFLCLPALYLAESKAAAAGYMVCVVWTGFSGFDLLSVAAVVPFLIWQIHKAQGQLALGYLTFLSAVPLIFTLLRLAYPWLNWYAALTVCVLALFSLEALIIRWKGMEIKPLSPVATGIVFITLIISSFQDIHSDYYWESHALVRISLLLALLILYAGVRLIKQPLRITHSDIWVGCMLLSLPAIWWWSNLLLVGLGIWFLVSGSKAFSLKRVNIGMLLLIFVIAARFLDSDLGLTERGIMFIVAGLGFMAANLLLYRKWREPR